MTGEVVTGVEAAIEETASVYSEGVKAHISHEVIATYAADAVRDVAGVADLASASLGQRLMTRDGVRVTIRDGDDPAASIDLDVHVLVEPGTACRRAGEAVASAARGYLAAMTDLRVRHVRCFVEGVAIR